MKETNLRGDPIPRQVKVFRDQIEERFEELCNIKDIYAGDPIIRDSIAKISGVLIAEFANPKLL